MSFLLPFLKSKFAALGAVIVIVCFIAFGGPFIFGSRYRLWFYLLAALILIGYLIYLGIKKLKAKKNAKMLEGFLNQQADDQLMSARPDVQDELAAIKEKLNRAIGVLKQSRMARGRRGADALYVLPWYMIIGPSASGKSTAIRNSGLHFPPVDPESDDPGKIKGLGGTRNCDWWFSNEGIILDTAGRYTLSANVQEDREEWTSFLDILRKSRPRAPINGLMLAISADEVLQMDADQLEAHAKALRGRIDELIIKLEILFPVYVLFTKCDLISGFVESFGAMGKGDREQVWGYTRNVEPVRGGMSDEFEAEFDALIDTLKRRRIPQLISEVSPVQKRGMYMFPVELDDAKSKLSNFLDTLFRPNPYQQNPLVRGVYFTSGTQEGTPIAKVIDAIGRNFGIAAEGGLRTEPVKETKAYFIRDLFQEVVLPDESLVHPTSHSWRRRKIMRAFVNAVQMIVTAAVVACLVISYNNNRRNNLSLLQTADGVAADTRGAVAFDLDKLDRLDMLREHLERIEAGPSLMSRWGLYSTDIVADAARKLYFDRYNGLMLAPTISLLEVSLHEPFGCDDQQMFDQQYNRFRAYRMLTLPWDSIPKSPGRLESEIKETWLPTVPDDRHVELESLVERQVAYYWKHRDNAAIPKIRGHANPQLIAMVNGMFDQCWNINRLYLMLINDVNEEMRDYSYEDALATLYLQGGTVGGAFTREGWEKHVLPKIDSMPVEIQRDPVKAQAFASYTPEQIQTELTNKYVADFVVQWKNFIASGRVTPFGRLEDAVVGTDQLAQDPFPMTKILEKVYEQGDIVDIHGERFRRIEDEFHTLGQFLGLGSAVPEGELHKDTYNKLLANLPGDIDAVKASLESSAQCGQTLRTFMDKVNQNQRLVSRLLTGQGLAAVALDLLTQPFDAVRAAARSSACDCLDREWKNQVWDAFNLELASVYPFNRDSDAGASPQQVQTFFQKLQSFQDREIDPAREQQIPISPKFQEALSAAQGIQRILGSGSTDKVRFTLGAAGLSGIRTMHFEYSTEPMWTYVAGQPQSRDYKWPQPGGGRCALWIEAIDNAFYPRLEFDGDWGIFKFFDKAQPRSGGKLAWTFESSNGRPLEVQLSLTGNQASFILNGHFTQFRCPETVCR